MAFSPSVDTLISVLEGGALTSFQYNSGPTAQYVMMNSGGILCSVSNLSASNINMWDANSTGQSSQNNVLTLPPGLTKVNWPVNNGVVLAVGANSGAAIPIPFKEGIDL